MFCALIRPVCGKFYPLDDIFIVVNLGCLMHEMGLDFIWLMWGGPPTVVYFEMCCWLAGLPTLFVCFVLMPISIFWFISTWRCRMSFDSF